MTKMSAPFQREERFIVVKRKRLNGNQEAVIRACIAAMGVETVECVVVESDWPEYETVWSMIEARCTGAQPVADAGGVTQADREEAAEFVFSPDNFAPDPEMRKRWPDAGEELPIVQAFARHRLQSVAAATAARDAALRCILNTARQDGGSKSDLQTALRLIASFADKALSEAREAGE